MNKNCIIIHGGPGDNKPTADHRLGEMHWMGWAKEKLNSLGINTVNPPMPDPWNPRYEDYKKEFEKYPVDENTNLIGHSRGCAFLVHWLGETKQRIKKLILVAPYKIAVGNNELKKKFYDFEIDPTIKDRVEEIIIFTSNNEEKEGKLSVQMYHDAIGGKIIDLPNHGHYAVKDMGTNEFPELIQAVGEEEFNQKDMDLDELKRSQWLIDNVGEIDSATKIRSADQNSVYKLQSEKGIFILKTGPGLKKERDNLVWLQGRLPVPQVINMRETADRDELLMSFLEGDDFARFAHRVPDEVFLKLLADALHMIHNLDISDYPSEERDETSVFIHGDACLPNFIIKDDKLNGFIDLGDAGVGDRETDLAAATWSLNFNFGPGLGIQFLKTYGVENPTQEHVDELIENYESDWSKRFR